MTMGKYEADRRKNDRATTQMDEICRQLNDEPTHQGTSYARKNVRRRQQKDQRVAIIAACSALVVILIVLIVIVAIGPADPVDDGRILPNVYAAGIDLGGMTPEEAESALHLATDTTIARKDMVVKLPEATLTLSPADTKVTLDVAKVVQAAYDHGRGGSEKEFLSAKEKAQSTTYTIPLLPYLHLDIAYIDATVEAFCAANGSQLSQPTWELDGRRPAFDPEHPDLPADHQALVITMGTPDYALSPRDISDAILDGYSLNDLTVEYQAPTRTEPEKPDAALLFQEFCVPAADATMDPSTYEVTPEVYGYGFDIEQAQALIDAAGYGQEVRLEMRFLMPEVTEAQLTKDLFTDRLGICTTKSEDCSDAWKTNLRLSVEALDGFVILPGAEFSFNVTVGKPTALKGYEEATVLLAGKETSVLGGGISQTASALYYCALLADMDILERHSADHAISYAELGLDADIAWGTRDLRLRNSADTPIRIHATLDGDEVTVELVGNDALEYRVEIKTDTVSTTDPDTILKVMDEDNVYDYTDGQILQEGIPGYEVQTSVDKYHKQTGDLITSTLVDTSIYQARDQIEVSIPTAETEPETEPETTPTEETTGGLLDFLTDLFN